MFKTIRSAIFIFLNETALLIGGITPSFLWPIIAPFALLPIAMIAVWADINNLSSEDIL